MITKDFILNKVISISDWQFESPRPELANKSNMSGENLVIESNGDINAIGWWRGMIDGLEIGSWYKACIKAEFTNIDNPGLSIFATASKHLLRPKKQNENTIEFELEFCHENDNNGSDFNLFLRAADKGGVEFFEPAVYQIDKPRHRTVKAATVRFDPDEKLNDLEDQRKRIADYLDQAGALKTDIVLLTEFCPIQGIKKYLEDFIKAAETVPNGPACAVFAQKAKEHKMYVIGGIIEQEGDYYYNTAVIFGRQGEFVGKYRKTHLTYGEVIEGVSAGRDYPVFDLDFGRIAIQTCYDQWFPEVARYYAHKGAEIIFEPVIGGKPITWRTRAIDNGLYIVTAGWTPPSMIIDSSGKILAENHHSGIAVTELNLDYRKANAYIDPTLVYGMPGIEPAMRMTSDDRMLKELHSLMEGQL